MTEDEEYAPYRWRRLWIAFGDTGGTAVRGLFSADVHHMIGDTPTARSLADLGDVRALLLRGEAGAGKTVAVQQEIERLRKAGQAVELVSLDDGVTDLSEVLKQRGRERDLTIFADGLDVGLIRDLALDVALKRAVAKLPASGGARLRIVVRSGYPADGLAEALEARFRRNFEHLALAPLRPEDVRTAAEASGLDAGAFLDALQGLRVAPLAGRPTTLLMLLRLWRERGGLPRLRTDLYQAGCEALLKEQNLFRLGAAGGDNPKFVGELSPDARLAVASRLAALMTFGNHEHLAFGPAARTTELHVEAVVGGTEPVSGDTMTVTRRHVREVVGSTLFRAAGKNLFTFSHPSFMRYLAARLIFPRKSGRG